MKPVNTKKHFLLGVVLISVIAIAAVQSASAGPWGGGPRWDRSPCGECDGSGIQRQELLDEQTAEARNAFLNETVELRKELTVKRAEKRALMLGDNPDSKRVAELTGESFDLREKLQTMAQEKGIKKTGFRHGPKRGCGGPVPRNFQRQL